MIMIGEVLAPGFRHEALLYAGPDRFVERTLPFIEEGLAAEEPILVVVAAAKIKRLRVALNGSADKVTFADMAEVGANPARIIPTWRDFLSHHADTGRPVRGIGEPIWADRSPAELVECQLHESLINLAFTDSPGFTLLCPYDTDTLDPDVIEEALRSHPCSLIEGAPQQNVSYRNVPWEGGPFEQPLPEPPTAAQLAFERLTDLERVRAFVANHAASHGLTAARAADLVLLVHEAAANSLMHGGGKGSLRIWAEAKTLICELRDQGRIDDPLIGRVRPSTDPQRGRGVWLIQQLADLAQIRSGDNGTTVRIHFTKN
jgi:anti-sigma regulatory factor (Ser/Thr protein kinase)